MALGYVNAQDTYHKEIFRSLADGVLGGEPSQVLYHKQLSVAMSNLESIFSLVKTLPDGRLECYFAPDTFIDNIKGETVEKRIALTFNEFYSNLEVMSRDGSNGKLYHSENVNWIERTGLTPVIYDNGFPVLSTNYAVDYNEGEILFTTEPVAGHRITCQYYYLFVIHDLHQDLFSSFDIRTMSKCDNQGYSCLDVLNPSFERVLTSGWTVDAECSRINEESTHGQKMLKITPSSSYSNCEQTIVIDDAISQVRLSCAVHHYQGSTAKIGVSMDGGTTWTECILTGTESEHKWRVISILSENHSTTTIKIKLSAKDEPAYFDMVVLTGAPL